MYYFFVTIAIFLSSTKSFTQEYKITLNPNGTTPLSAIIEFEETNTEPVTIYVKGKTPEESIGYTYDANYGTKFAVHGLYGDYTNTIAIKYKTKNLKEYLIYVSPYEIVSQSPPVPGSETDEGEKVTIETQVMFDTLPREGTKNPELYFTSTPTAGAIIGFDRRGTIRYLYQPNLKQARNRRPHIARMRANRQGVFFELLTSHQFYEKIDLLGNEISTQKIDAHHDAIPYKDGQTILLGNSRWGWEDVLFIIDSAGKLKQIINMGDIIRKATSVKDRPLLSRLIYDDKNVYIGNDKKRVRVDWFHANSVVYDWDRDLLYISSRHHGVFAIKPFPLSLVWYMSADDLEIDRSQGKDYGTLPYESVYLKDIPSLQKYRMTMIKGTAPKGQHGLLLRNNGNLLLFDNQSDEKVNTNGSRVVEYKIDHENRTAEQVFEFKTRDNAYSRYVSDVDLSGNNYQNILAFFGMSKPRRIVELDKTGKVLYEMEIATRSILYRIDKFPLYPYKNNRRRYSVDYLEPKFKNNSSNE